MLIEFSLENFRSFKSKQIFSMLASSDSIFEEKNTFLAPGLNKFRLNKSSIIYGANASGKSNLIKAMRFLEAFVCGSATILSENDQIDVVPFKLDREYVNRPSTFEVMFIKDEVRYHFGLTVDKVRVHEEWLAAYPKGRRQIWYERFYDKETDSTSWIFGPELKGEKERIKGFVRNNSLYISHAAQNNHPQLTKVWKWFRETFACLVSPDAVQTWTANMCNKNEEFCRSVINFLKVADAGILDISIEEMPIDEDFFSMLSDEVKAKLFQKSKDVKMQKVSTIHSDVEGNKITFDIDEESDGTKRLFNVSGPLLDVLQKGMIIYIDELDRSMHPKLTRHIVSLFHNVNVNAKMAQLVCTSHDVSLLDQKELFRRDQIWFVKKESDGSSKLYSLSQFGVRKDESLQKGYLAGRYSAIPVIEEGEL